MRERRPCGALPHSFDKGDRQPVCRSRPRGPETAFKPLPIRHAPSFEPSTLFRPHAHTLSGALQASDVVLQGSEAVERPAAITAMTTGSSMGRNRLRTSTEHSRRYVSVFFRKIWSMSCSIDEWLAKTDYILVNYLPFRNSARMKRLLCHQSREWADDRQSQRPLQGELR